MDRPQVEHDLEVLGLDAVQDALSQRYSSLRITDATSPQVMGVSWAQLGPVRLERLQLHLAASADIEAHGFLAFSHRHAGTAAYTVGNEERRYGAGDVYLITNPDDPYHSEFADTDTTMAIFDPQLLADVAESEPNGLHGRATRFTGYEPISQPAAENWKRLLGYLWTAARGQSALGDENLIAGPAARFLVATALATFPNTAIVDPTYRDRNDGGSQTLRRAIGFIESSAGEDISIADIAAAANVTMRAVQLAFRRHLDTTPLAYLRRVRLLRAHEELLIPTDNTTVAAVANRWGFHNAGRFAAAYQDEFAELPSQTLRR